MEDHNDQLRWGIIVDGLRGDTDIAAHANWFCKTGGDRGVCQVTLVDVACIYVNLFVGRDVHDTQAVALLVLLSPDQLQVHNQELLVRVLDGYVNRSVEPSNFVEP